jgi:hypothetical protein
MLSSENASLLAYSSKYEMCNTTLLLSLRAKKLFNTTEHQDIITRGGVGIYIVLRFRLRQIYSREIRPVYPSDMKVGESQSLPGHHGEDRPVSFLVKIRISTSCWWSK